MVKYGEIVSVYGVGLLDTLGIGLSVGGAGLIPVPLSASQDAAGRSQIKYLLPPPAHTDPLFYIGAGGFGFSTHPGRGVRRDLLQPHQNFPAPIHLQTSSPVPGASPKFLLFANPAPAFAALP